ncbi:MAG: DUF1573 domain-containing protein [Patescibacteria group bacterium]
MAKRIDPVVLGIIIITVLVGGGIIALAASKEKAPIVQYQQNDAARPQVRVSETSFEMGTMKLSDTKSQDVTLTNTGTKELVLSDVVTSCDCTFAQVTVAGRVSKEFSMRRDPVWSEVVSPGETATVKITYKPSIMPVKGNVSRSVAIKTNDPGQPLVTIKFSANVQL